jgi:hypothetical protein
MHGGFDNKLMFCLFYKSQFGDCNFICIYKINLVCRKLSFSVKQNRDFWEFVFVN